jgi:hypothetical protein
MNRGATEHGHLVAVRLAQLSGDARQVRRCAHVAGQHLEVARQVVARGNGGSELAPPLHVGPLLTHGDDQQDADPPLLLLRSLELGELPRPLRHSLHHNLADHDRRYPAVGLVRQVECQRLGPGGNRLARGHRGTAAHGPARHLGGFAEANQHHPFGALLRIDRCCLVALAGEIAALEEAGQLASYVGVESEEGTGELAVAQLADGHGEHRRGNTLERDDLNRGIHADFDPV